MHPSVRNYFIKFNHAFEDTIEYMYLDIKGLVTIGVGNLIDVEMANDTKNLKKVMDDLIKLPFVYKPAPRITNAGQNASAAEIEAEWKLVKEKQEHAKRGHTAFAIFTKLKLEEKTINDLAIKKAEAMERELKTDPSFMNFDQWPADAQLGLLSMAWALGASKIRLGWPNFKAACLKQDFDDMAKRCHINDAGNPGVAPRNDANRHLFKNAAAILANEGSNLAENINQRMTLYYPHMLLKKIVIRA